MGNVDEPGVVVHLDEGDDAKQESVLRNITNMLVELGADTVVELVVHGAGLSAATAAGPHAGEVRALLDQGVTVAACANTMHAKGIGPEQLIDGVDIVPAGIAELVRRQREGWAYVRP